MKRSQVPLSRGKPLSKGTVGLTRGSKLKSRPKTPEEKQQQSEDIEKMHQLFERHWILEWRGCFHQCENCGTVIYGEDKTLYHHHLLEKGIARYEHLKYEIDNLMLLCEPCHTRTSNGYPGEKVIERTNQAHKQFGV